MFVYCQKLRGRGLQYSTVDVKKENIQKSKPHLKFFVKYSEDEGYNRCKKRENIQISKPHHNFFIVL